MTIFAEFPVRNCRDGWRRRPAPGRGAASGRRVSAAPSRRRWPRNAPWLRSGGSFAISPGTSAEATRWPLTLRVILHVGAAALPWWLLARALAAL